MRLGRQKDLIDQCGTVRPIEGMWGLQVGVISWSGVAFRQDIERGDAESHCNCSVDWYFFESNLFCRYNFLL